MEYYYKLLFIFALLCLFPLGSFLLLNNRLVSLFCHFFRNLWTQRSLSKEEREEEEEEEEKEEDEEVKEEDE